MTNNILIIDFGSQVTQLIARTVREQQVYAEIVSPEITLTEIKHKSPAAIILSGGPNSVNDEDFLTIDPQILKQNIPILGICYGMQLICKLFGGKVAKSDKQEYGVTTIDIILNDKIFNYFIDNYDRKKVNEKFVATEVLMSHADKITKLPDDFITIATSVNSNHAAIKHKNLEIYGLQFHPEVTHSTHGKEIIKSFIFDIANCSPSWTMANYLDIQIDLIQKQTQNNKVLCALSGGVDSTVTAVLLHKAIGNKLTCFFVDTGLLRYKEAEEVRELFAHNLALKHFHYIDAKELFLKRLKNISDPEQKRKIIGKTFIDLFEKEASKDKAIKFLAQGTLYPDVIESNHPKQGKSSTIKSHHNVGGLPDNMQLELVEPLRELFKDEVRHLGAHLNISKQNLYRHPFPGPGLAIRILGEITQEKIQILQAADYIYIRELKKHNLYDKIWQAFCVLLPIKTVGVMGDSRTYEYCLSLRAVTSRDGMTASYYPFEHKFLEYISTSIINEVKNINRVVYDITSKPPGTIEWE